MAVAQGQLIDVKGLQTVNRALRQVAPDLRREMFADLGGMFKARVNAAKIRMPYRRKRPGQQNSHMHLRTSTILTKAGSAPAVRMGGGGTRQGMFGFQAITGAPHATILDVAQPKGPITRAITEKYGAAPRFLAGEFLPSGRGGTQMWRESKNIVQRYVDRLNARIESQAGAA